MKNRTIIIIMVLVIILGVVIGYEYRKGVMNNRDEENVQNVEENEEKSGKITVEEATKLLEEKYGKKDEMTGNTMSYGYITTVKDSEGNEYYFFRHNWLVDNSHMSFLQNIFVSLDGKTIRTTNDPVSYEENQVVDFGNIKTEYKQLLVSLYGENPGKELTYTVSDINGDKISELIVKIGTCEADYVITFYSYSDYKIVNLGEIPGGQMNLYEENGKDYLFGLYAHMGYEKISNIEIVDNKIKETQISEREVPASEEYAHGDKLLEWNNYNDYSKLENI